MKIEMLDWKWFGNAGHFVMGEWCRFHLCTQIGDVLVSTVGELFYDAPIREITAQTRGIKLEGRGDARVFDYRQKIGYEDIGHNRKFETMVFKLTGDICPCGCAMPMHDGAEIDGDGYNSAIEATAGHMALCAKWSTPLASASETSG